MARKRKQLVLVAIVVVAVVFVAIAIVTQVRDSQDDTPAQKVDAIGYWQEPPEVWKTPGDAESVAVEIDEKRGPVIRVSPSQTVVMTPRLEGVDFAWELAESSADYWTIVGRAKLGDSRVDASWHFAQGNPQAFFSLSIEDLPMEAVEGGLEAIMELPAGDVRLLDDTMRLVPFARETKRISGWTPGWLRWAGTGRTIEISSWWANHVSIGQTDGSAVQVSLNLVDPQTMADIEAGCEETTFDIETRLKWSVGALPVVVPGRLARGAEAALVPVFIPPGSHFNTAFDEIKPPEASAWARQVATLALGHSSPEDPRYGNGGISGTHLGGTIISPRGMKDPALDELAVRLDDTRVEFDPAQGPVFGEPPACDSSRLWLRDATRFEAGFSNSILLNSSVGFNGKVPESMALEVLDGTREQLLDQALSKLYLERLRRERGIFAFASPLVATRNPLTTAAKEGLLVPERHGQWTLAPELVRAFADIELWREGNRSVVFTSVEEALGQWSRARACEIHIRASGEARVKCPESVAEMTLVADGTHVPRVGEQTIEHEVRDPTRRPQTWMWTDITDEAAHISLSVENPPTPVNWVIPAR